VGQTGKKRKGRREERGREGVGGAELVAAALLHTHMLDINVQLEEPIKPEFEPQI